MAFKILVTSQKGGVGKSTLSANLAAYFSVQQHQRTALLDWDPHGSSSNWLNSAPDAGVQVVHQPLPVDQGGNRPIFDARTQMRRVASQCEVLVVDLTWSDSLASELMFEFDMILVPTSVSEIELAATSGFLSRHRWVFEAASSKRPLLVVCPTRVLPEQLATQVFSKQRFQVSFMLAPAILEGQKARDLFQRGYLMNQTDLCGQSFHDFAKAIISARDIRIAQSKLPPLPQNPRGEAIKTASGHPTPQRSSVLDGLAASAQYSVLGRYRARRQSEGEGQADKPVTTLGMPEFLKRLTRSAAKL